MERVGTTMTNRRVAETLFNIATMLDMAQDNIYRVRAYRRAARRMLALREEAACILARGDELPLPGVGARVRRKLGELISSGTMSYYQDLLEELPEPLANLMVVPGMGPRTAARLYAELGVSTPEGLAQAARRGRVRTLYGFGPRSEQVLLDAALLASATRRRVA